MGNQCFIIFSKISGSIETRKLLGKNIKQVENDYIDRMVLVGKLDGNEMYPTIEYDCKWVIVDVSNGIVSNIDSFN